MLVGTSALARGLAPGPGNWKPIDVNTDAVRLLDGSGFTATFREEDPAKCPPAANCVATGYVTIAARLDHCTNDALFTHQIVLQNDGTYDVYISALELRNARGATALCVAAKVARSDIRLGLQVNGPLNEKNVRLHFARSIQ